MSADLRSSLLGRWVGNYRIAALVGEGGMGLVFVAEHASIERRVAIKVLKDEMARDGDVVRRFVGEARTASAIRHPNVVEIFDAGTLEPDGTAYIVMELLEGESLAARIARLSRIPVAEAIDFAGQIAAALAAAHAR